MRFDLYTRMPLVLVNNKMNEGIYVRINQCIQTDLLKLEKRFWSCKEQIKLAFDQLCSTYQFITKSFMNSSLFSMCSVILFNVSNLSTLLVNQQQNYCVIKLPRKLNCIISLSNWRYNSMPKLSVTDWTEYFILQQISGIIIRMFRIEREVVAYWWFTLLVLTQLFTYTNVLVVLFDKTLL